MSEFATWYMVAVGNVGDPIVPSVKYDDLGFACDVSRDLAERGVTNRVLKITEVAVFRGIKHFVVRTDCMSRTWPGCPCKTCKDAKGCGCTNGCKAWDCPNV